LTSLISGYFVAQVIAQKSYDRYVSPTYEAMDRLELDQARAALQQHGAQGVATYMASLDAAFGGKHFLLSKDGIDLTAGKSGALLPAAHSRRFRGYIHGVFHLAQLFGDGQMGMRVISRRQDEIGQVAATFNAMAERVEQSFRTERSLLQDISHELRAPLARLTLAVHLG
jgi:signal transduction histidine kinase